MLLAGPFTFDHCAAKPLCYLFFNCCLSQLCGLRGNCLYNEGVLTWNVCYVLRFHIDNFSFHFMPHNEDCSCCWHCTFDEQASIFFPSWLPISYELFSVCHLLIYIASTLKGTHIIGSMNILTLESTFGEVCRKLKKCIPHARTKLFILIKHFMLDKAVGSGMMISMYYFYQ